MRGAIRFVVMLAAWVMASAMFANDAGRAWLGIIVTSEPGGGARLLAVVPGGPAERAGLRPDDVLLELDGWPWSDEAAAEGWLARIRPEQQVAYRVERSAVEHVGLLVVGSRAERSGSFVVAPVPSVTRTAGGFRPGFVPVAIPETVRRSLGAPDDLGVLLGAVEPRSAAEIAGFRTGDVVTRFGEHPVRSPTEVYSALRATRSGDPVAVEFVRDRVRRTLSLRYEPGAPAPAPAPAPDAPAVSPGEWRSRMLRDEIEFLRDRLQRLERELEALARDD